MQMQRWLIAATLAAVGALASACQNDSGTTPPAHVHSTALIAVNQSAVSLTTGEHATLQATPKCSCGETMPSTISWTSSNDAVASVTSAGEVTAVSFGTANVTASADGKSVVVAVTVLPLGTVIGPAGGVVMSADSGAILEIAAGALDTPIDITIVKLDNAAFGGDSLYLPGSGYEIRPNGVTLRVTARLRLRYDSAHLPAGVFQEQLRIRERDRQQNQWRDCDGQARQGQTVTAMIQHFGAYGIVVQPPVGKLVGPAGGTVTSSDGNVELVIPSGALDSVVDVSIVKADESTLVGDSTFVAGTAYELRPLATQLRTMATVRIHYDPDSLPAGMDRDRLRIQQRLRDQQRWQDCDQSRIQQNFVSANINAFGLIGITGQWAGSGGGRSITMRTMSSR